MVQRRHRNLTLPFVAVGAGFLAAALVSLVTAGVPTALGMALGAITLFFFAYMEKSARERQRLLTNESEEAIAARERAYLEERAAERAKAGSQTYPTGEVDHEAQLARQRAKAMSGVSTGTASERDEIQRLKQIAETALRSGDLSTAQQSYRALLLMTLGKDSPISKAEVYYGLGVVHERTGETRKAIQFLERATSGDPDLTRAFDLLSKLRP